MRPLLVIFQFRLIDRFLRSVEQLKFDKLWIRFYPQTEAYPKARDWFLKSDYTHFILLPDDLIVTQSDLERLLQDSDKKGYQVISGYCNVNTTTGKDDALISYSLPPDPPYTSTYQNYRFLKMAHLAGSTHIIEVNYQGTAPSVISREIVQQIPFRHSWGCCIDSCFSLDLDRAGIKQYVDLSVKTQHLKIDDDSQTLLSQVDKLPRSLEYQKLAV